MDTVARMISIEGTSLVYALLLLPALIFIILKIFKPTKSLPLPPGPRPWPLLGNVHQIGAKPHITLANLASEYGPIMSVKLGTKLMVVGSSPEAAKEILKTQDRVLSGRYVPHSLPFKGSESINTISMVWATECDEAWKTFRSVSRTDMFSNKALESQAGLRERKALELVQQIGRMEGKAVKIAEAVFAVVFNSLSTILMSRDFIGVEGGSGVEGEMKQIFREILELGVAPNLSDLYPVLRGLDLQRLNKRSRQLHTKACTMWASTIKERRERKESRDTRKPDLLDVLIENNFVDAQINQYFLV